MKFIFDGVVNPIILVFLYKYQFIYPITSLMSISVSDTSQGMFSKKKDTSQGMKGTVPTTSH
jgi:hypothetical protein